MSFIYPLGLLGLIGVPIVIVIYILRSKYNEQTVSSTYIWRLSDKFLKRKNPLSGLTGLISLILQILLISAVSFAIARPIFTLPNAANEYCFVLDSSGSMNMQNGKQNRFELAKEEIVDIIKDSADGSSYTLISVSDEIRDVFEGVTDKDFAIELVGNCEAEYTSAEYADVFGVAQEHFTLHPSSAIYVVTDKSYDDIYGVEVIDVSGEGEQNYGVFNVAYSHSGGRLTVTAEVVSYASDAELDVALTVDGLNEPIKQTVSVRAGERTPVTVECVCPRFSSLTLAIENSDVYSADNSISAYNAKSESSYSTLIVSETGFFLHAAIDAILDSEVKIVTPKEYEAMTEAQLSYGLYIYDSYEPAELPEDGAVWLINADTAVTGSGFGIRGRVSLEEAAEIEKSKSTSTAVRALLEGVDGRDIYVKNYVKYSGLYLNFSTLFSYDSNPLIFAGSNSQGNRQVVFAFDLHESDFALSTDFIILLGNLLEYSFPDVLDKTDYIVGEEAIINVIAGAESMKIVAPSGKEVYADSDGTTAILKLDEVGAYNIEITVAGKAHSYTLFSAANEAESLPENDGGSLALSGVRVEGNIDGTFDPTLILFICILVIFIADWGVYCYEKYQLR